MNDSIIFIDELTGVYNRRYLKEKQEAILQSYIAEQKPFSLAMVDIDHFKDINDVHGHLVGDTIIRDFASLLQSLLRKSDTIIRYGGDEFVCIMPGLHKADAEQMHRRIADTIKDHAFNDLKLTISVGIVSYPDDGDNLWVLVQCADQAMYDAKRSGRDRVSTIQEKKAQIPIATFINRKQEQDIIHKKLVDAQHGIRAIVIYGIVGAGKTRLGKEVLRKIKGKEIIWSDCIYFSDTISYFPIRELIKYHVQRHGLNIMQRLSPVYRREIGKLIPEVSDAGEQTEVMDTVLDRYRLYEGIRQFLEFGEREKVIVIDNIQWIDKESIEVLKYLMRALRDLPIVFMFIHRSEEKTVLLDDFLLYMSREAQAGEINVEPFGRAETRDAVKAIIGDDPDDKVTEYIIQESGGIPFYIEEIMRALLDERYLRVEESKWVFTVPEREVLPKNLTDIAIKKYRTVSGEARNVLDIASVIGWFDLEIIQIISGYNEGHVHGLIHEIMRIGLIRLSNDRYEFTEAISRNAIYSNSVKGAKTQNIHLQVGKYLEQRHKGKEHEIADALAIHYYYANNKDKCLQYCMIAGDKARATYANRAAIKLYTWALENIADDGIRGQAQRIDLLRKRAGILRFIGDTKRALQDLDAALQFALQTTDHKHEADLRYDKSMIHQILNEYPLVYEEAEKALILYKDLDAHKEMAMVLRTIGTALYNQGKYDESLRKLEESIRISESIDDPLNIAQVKHSLANYYTHNGEYDKALTLYSEAADMFHAVDNRFYEAKSLANKGNIYHRLGDRERAVKIYKDTLNIFQEIGNRTDEAISLMNIGSMYGYSGNYERALEYYQDCLRIHRDIGSKDWESMLLSGCGMIHHDLGNYQEAKNLYEQALEIARRIEVDNLISYALHCLGDLNITLEQYNRAEDYLIEAYNASAGKRDVVMDISASFAELYLQQGNLQEFKNKIKELQDIYADTKTIRLKAKIDLLLGRFNVIAGGFPKAEEYINAALKTFLSLNEPMVIGQTYYYLGYMFERKGDQQKTVEAYKQALEYFNVTQAKGWFKKATQALKSNQGVL